MSLYADRIYTFVLLMFKLDAVTKNAQDSGFLKIEKLMIIIFIDSTISRI